MIGAVNLRADLSTLAETTGFSGVIAVSRNGERLFELARGFAHRASGRPNTLDTQFATASA